PARLLSFSWREALELRRDPIRLTLASAGSVILMIVLGYGISMDVQNLKFAALDLDQSIASQSYINDLSGSRYFDEQPPIADHADLDRRMRSGEISLALEIPPGFAADLERGRQVAIGAWFDGAMPSRGHTVPRQYCARLCPCHAPARAGRAASSGLWRRCRGRPPHAGSPLPLQPRCRKPCRDGAGGDSASADADPRDAGCAIGHAREG